MLVVAHGNSLRALVKMLDGMSDADIVEFNIPTGVPIHYELDDALKPKSRRFLGDPEAIKAAAEAVARQTEGRRAESRERPQKGNIVGGSRLNIRSFIPFTGSDVP